LTIKLYDIVYIGGGGGTPEYRSHGNMPPPYADYMHARYTANFPDFEFFKEQ